MFLIKTKIKKTYVRVAELKIIPINYNTKKLKQTKWMRNSTRCGLVYDSYYQHDLTETASPCLRTEQPD